MRRRPTTEQILDDLYAGTLDSTLWSRALVSIADRLGSSGAVLFAVNPRSELLRRDEVHRVDRHAAQESRHRRTPLELRIPAAIDAPVGEPRFDARVLSRRGREHGAIVNDFLIRRDVPHVLATWLHKSPGKAVGLSFQANQHRGPFDSRDAARVKRFIPHIQRALAIRDRLESAQARADTLASSLDRLRAGVLSLDGAGKVLELNRSAAELLRTKFTVSRHPDGSLCLAEPAGSRLRRWIERSAVPERSIGGVTRTLCPDGRPALTVVLAPIRTLPMSWLGIDPHWLVFLFDANRPAVADPGQLAGELGLTAREADIAMLLASGEKLPDIARRLDISVHTARVHLKHLFEKTSARSQADLVRQILASASAMLARPR